MVDQLARRYGRTPAEILDSSVEEFVINWMCYQEADAASEHLLKRLNASGTPVFPTVSLK